MRNSYRPYETVKSKLQRILLPRKYRKDYIKLGTSDLIKELKSSGVIVLDNEYEDIKIGGETIRIDGMYDYAFGLNGNNDTDKDTIEGGVYDFLTEL